jgi:2-iminobutanoate/2-iminopropanoate deaminase
MSAGEGINYLNSPGLMQPAGHYSHACVAGGIAYISGQLPVDESGAALSDQPFEVQVKRVLANLDACLAVAGSDRSRLLQVRVYIVDMSLWSSFNDIYGGWIGDSRPARAVAGVSSLHYGASLEIEATALCFQIKRDVQLQSRS